MKTRVMAALLAALWMAACGSPAAPPTTAAGMATALPTARPDLSPVPRDTADVSHLLIGDGHFSSSPRAGYLWPCQTNFTGGGAFASGDWFNGDGTYDLTKKPVVDGSVSWPHEFDIFVSGDLRMLEGNGLPDHPTGIYPISTGDDAYAFDRNPNTITAQDNHIQLPANPTLADAPACVGGMVGITISGVPLFNGVDAGGRDAVANEIQDSCQGHPQRSGVYHYHGLSSCLPDEGQGHSALLGWALDGFGLYGPYGENGEVLTSASLDECHGHTHVVVWDGQPVNMFHYHLTYDFPYSVGCYRGTPTMVRIGAGEQPPAGP